MYAEAFRRKRNRQLTEPKAGRRSGSAVGQPGQGSGNGQPVSGGR
jgi:hypothetical protein